MMEEEELGEEGEEGADGMVNGERDDGIVEIGAPGDGAGEAVNPADRITTPYMTRFERARVLGTRALQIRCGLRPARAPAARPAPLLMRPTPTPPFAWPRFPQHECPCDG
jgi:DNA-directed RNA polymerase I, II, and III subunit RPABC2